MTAAKNIPFICINCIARCKRTNGADALDALGALLEGQAFPKEHCALHSGELWPWPSSPASVLTLVPSFNFG